MTAKGLVCRRAVVLAAVLALAACGGGGGGGGGGPADGGTAPPVPVPVPDVPVRVTGTTPFAAGCDGGAGFGTRYASAEVEPMIAVNPRDAGNLVGVWQQDRWVTGGAQGVMTGASFDGGRTWERRAAAFSRCTGGNAANGGDYERATDPWVSFSPDGTAHQIALALRGSTFQPGSVNAILASRSTDGGRTWSDPVTLRIDGSDAFNDKESITADPADSRLVYATWDRLNVGGGGPTWFSRSTDGGRTWEAARPIHDPGAARQTINNQIVVLPDGTLVNFFTELDQTAAAPRTTTLTVIRSLDKGVTWSAPVAVAEVLALGTADPDAGTPIRDGALLGAIAAGPGGELAAVWQDSRFSGGVRDAVAFSRSPDGGLTWSDPVRVNREPAVPAFMPSVTVRRDGTIGVGYYDLRNNTADRATLPTDYWLARSADGVIWTEIHVDGPFDLSIAPNANGLFIGDYHGARQHRRRLRPVLRADQRRRPGQPHRRVRVRRARHRGRPVDPGRSGRRRAGDRDEGAGGAAAGAHRRAAAAPRRHRAPHAAAAGARVDAAGRRAAMSPRRDARRRPQSSVRR